ncbi:MAG: radical SAM protein [Bacteroidales bacterium]|nr:radical SAM protein [Bacteroidales bacterium]
MKKKENYQKFLSIDLTKNCTNNCLFCVVEGRSGKATDQEFSDVEKFLRFYKSHGFDSVNLHGGEPTIYKRFKDLIILINELGYKDITVQTNGCRLENEEFVSFLIKNRVTLFVVSFHDCDKESHNTLTKNPKSFDQATNGIKTVLRLGGDVRTNTVLVKDNYKRVTQIVDFLYDLNVKKFNISSLNPYWLWLEKQQELFDQLVPSYQELSPHLCEMLDKYATKDVKITLEGFPYCLFPGYDDYNLYSYTREITLLSDFEKSIIDYENFLNENGIRLKRQECQKCIKNNQCRGVWKGYLKNKGWAEFQPISLQSTVNK